MVTLPLFSPRLLVARRAIRQAIHRVSQQPPDQRFTVLALESSADDTCVAVVTSEREILSNVVIKQHDQHEQFGGIHPIVAISAHERNMPGAVRRALDDAGRTMDQIDGIAFTRGPGIGGCLAVGSNAAKTLASALNKPLVGVHHMQAHALTVFLTSPPDLRPSFPFLALLISGGHSLILLATATTAFRTLATCTDDSAGRAFDKVSRALGLPWSTRGPGVALEQFCLTELPAEDTSRLPHIVPFSIPSLGRLAFSFSAPHSAVVQYIAQQKGVLSHAHKLALARTFQAAVAAQLEEKLTLALRWCEGNGVSVRHVAVSGGVASNAFLRQRLYSCVEAGYPGDSISLIFPPASLCTDNAAMIAWASVHRFLTCNHDDYSIQTRAKWDIENLDL